MRGLMAVFGLILFAALGVLSYSIQTHTEKLSIHVTNKERLLKVDTDKDGSTSTSYKNFVYTDDETYVIEDSFWNWHFRAGTVYAKIHPNQTCDVVVAGYRVGFFSMYQNIIEAECHA